MDDLQRRALEWIGGDHVGISSKCIWRTMMGVDESKAPARDRGFYPLDPSDFWRCRRLLLAIPEWRERMGEMSKHGAVWAALVDRWDEIDAQFVAEVGEVPDYFASAPKTYELMK